MRGIVFTALLVALPAAAVPQVRFTCDGAACTAADTATVLDTVTGLEWERSPTAATYTWLEALAHCQALSLGGMDDWRLPSMKELLSLIDYESAEGFDVVALKTPEKSFTWSSSPYQADPALAWGVYFNYGGSNNAAPTVQKYPARCVR